MAGAEGLEPSTKVLETHVLPLHHAPQHFFHYTRVFHFVNQKFYKKDRRTVGLQYILDKHKKGKRDRVSYAKVELPHNNFTKGDHIPHEQEYNTRHGVSAISDEVCREIRR